ncbi:acyl transferase domain-containing protein/NADPH:quinone reductase-like Zn-dependent oxidoreductase [Paenibacillus sp. JGP012]|uniref:beta-ketoacyl synthase N-terminal-like domain-containing protein n=1 Tax=Paenibacillus sp. JGP012 TaxID=2735914 RepID=UPI00160D504D|nr:beta-ketoacyl synthase N-terminal-like domain-containing protein [Paenibacillus sp. JGP012]MBB6023618.1 acyl transferase domain-containing protein/NADPH:quinone reductase-like Zn-dependent oxidoreductase [Paenibacillus sp. JGP012]
MNNPVKTKIEQLIRQGVISAQDGMNLLRQMNGNGEGKVSLPSSFQAVVLERPSHTQQLNVCTQEDREPRAGEVQILVQAFPINFSDFLLIKGLYPMMPEYPFTPGVEVSGIIRKVGPDVTSVQVGDEVIGVMRIECGGQGGLVITDASLVVRKPDNLSHEEACGMPAAFLSMYIALEKAGIKSGDRVFIPAAAGTNGLIAVQLARLAGAEVYASASTEEKLEALRQMGVNHLMNHQKENVVNEILHETGGRGVDIVINTIAGPSIQQGLNVLAPEGRYVEIAVFGLQTSGGLDLSRLVDNQTFFSFNVKKFLSFHPELRQHYLGKMVALLGQGLVKPRIAQVFPFSEIRAAYACKQDRNLIGRVVVAMPQIEQLPPPRVRAKAQRSQMLKEPIFANSDPGKEQRTGQNDIAVIGMSGRFADAGNVDEFWDNLKNGKNSIVEIPMERWDNRPHFDPDHRKWDKTNNNWGGFLRDADKFDALFFQISGREAEQMDPQQRLFLEESWRALEDAGYALESGERINCGVFVGAAKGDYVGKMQDGGKPTEAQSFWGNESSILAARISYHLNFSGPAIAIDTACSSSLVAIHMACQSLRIGECEMALAGGAFVYTTPAFIKVASSGGMLSPRGQCRTFDQGADGFVPGEAVAAVLLKPLHAALRDGDQIHGVIKGSKINQDGKTNGITAPSARAQSEVQSALYREFGINPRTISYVEAHGTGTKLGDPIEIEGLTQSFRSYTDDKGFCAIGSVKTNIGHTAAAAGITGLIKVLLAMRHQKIPASLNFEKPNEHIDFAASPFRVNTQLKSWETAEGVRRAAINSFGFSGTNAHLVVEEPPSRQVRQDQRARLHLIPLSAQSASSLHALRSQMARYLEKHGAETELGDLAYTLQRRRSHFQHRLAFVVSSMSKLIKLLRTDPQPAEHPALAEAIAKQEAIVAVDSGEWMARLSRVKDSQEEAEILDLLARRYEAGFDLDFSEMSRGKVMSLPSYPFEGESFWVAESGHIQPEPLARTMIQRLHPLIERNTSTLSSQSYSTMLHSEAFYLKDHQVKGKRLFPGACCLEMARAAGELAMEQRVTRISDVRWIKPVMVDQELNLNISLIPSEAGGVAFEIYTEKKLSEREIHCTGKLRFEENEAVKRPSMGRFSGNVDSLQQIVLSAEHIYGMFEKRGFHYGPDFRSIKALRLNAERSESVAELCLPDGVKGEAATFGIHPSLLDGAWQSLLGFVGQESESGTYLPIGFEEVEIYRKLTGNAVCHMAMTSNEAMRKSFDLVIYDEDGELALWMRGFTIQLWKESNTDMQVMRLLQELEQGERVLAEVEHALERLWGSV